jgi:glutathione synthase/RimK-type ligase-like ATP-grasp enzyme
MRAVACPEMASSPPLVLVATCAEIPQEHPDDAGLGAALARRGAQARWAAWDDAGVDWGAAALVVVRSTWDYAPRRDAFVAWAESLPRVRNAAAVLRWNTDKRYLARLEAAGVPVVPTRYLAPGERLASPPGPFVVKPTVSAGSRDTFRYAAGDAAAAQAHIDALHAEGRWAMVQPYVGSVDARGETALVFIAGAFSHALAKGPMLRPGAGRVDGLYAEEDLSARAPTAAERATAEAVLDAGPFERAELLYARVDLVEGDDGPQLLELELTEPSLFLQHAPGAADRLADGIVAVL